MPRFLSRGHSPAVTDISRINIVENGKKNAGCGSRRQDLVPRPLSAPAKHSSCQSIAVRLILGEEGIGLRSAGRFDEGLLVSGPARYDILPVSRSLVPSSNSGARVLVPGKTSQRESRAHRPSSTSARISAATSRRNQRARRDAEKDKEKSCSFLFRALL